MQFALALTIFIAGILCTLRLGGEPFRALRHLGGGRDAGRGALPPFAALSSALCGTLGVGSVLAVLPALAQGGPGTLVPLWLGSLTGCSLKYAEILITMRHRSDTLSGAMVALQEKSPLLGALYALLCLPVALLGMGNLAQAQALSQTLYVCAGVPRWATALPVLILLAALTAGGLRRIGRASEVALPVFGGVYVALCLWALWRLRAALPTVFSGILHGFAPDARTFALGVARGLFISEAGLGTSAFAHSQSTAHPSAQGALGVCEVLFSTLLCTLTALVALATGVPLTGDAAQTAQAVFSAAMGTAGPALLCAMLCFFALSTLPVWWFYGLQCVRFLFRRAWAQRVYTVLFLLTAFAGCLLPVHGVWSAADVFNLLLALPCLAMLALYRRELGCKPLANPPCSMYTHLQKRAAPRGKIRRRT